MVLSNWWRKFYKIKKSVVHTHTRTTHARKSNKFFRKSIKYREGDKEDTKKKMAMRKKKRIEKPVRQTVIYKFYTIPRNSTQTSNTKRESEVCGHTYDECINVIIILSIIEKRIGEQRKKKLEWKRLKINRFSLSLSCSCSLAAWPMIHSSQFIFTLEWSQMRKAVLVHIPCVCVFDDTRKRWGAAEENCISRSFVNTLDAKALWLAANVVQPQVENDRK